MGRLKQKGKAGTAKNYVTRSAAVRKLQISLADFRRLCILKGIFPREPKNKKKANKGSSVPTSFYYAKDIAYLAHEPILRKLREHKAFAKKLSRALGRGEWSSAKSLEDNKPVYKLDHVIKERYPSFIDALRDIDDALSLVSLFASLPAASKVPASLIENCTRLCSEWQLYIMHTRALRKAFFSIKGIYFQAEVMDQSITWLIPYQFTQNIPPDVDVRVMLTFLELYQTLLGFVFFKLYTDAGLVYPPPHDTDKDASGAGVDAFSLRSANGRPTAAHGQRPVPVEGKKVAGKHVRQAINAIATDVSQEADSIALPHVVEDAIDTLSGDEFVAQASKTATDESSSLTTLRTLTSLPSSAVANLFSSYTFYISRETSRLLFEFIIRSCGGRVGWPLTSGSGSPFDESDGSITHVIIDRPLPENLKESQQENDWRRRRKYIQPQWVVDCVNAGKLLPEDPYLQGMVLPPHLSPFGEDAGAYDPLQTTENAMDVSEEEEEEKTESVEQLNAIDSTEAKMTIDDTIGRIVKDPEQLRVVELEAEARGIAFEDFEKKINKAAKKHNESKNDQMTGDNELEMNKMMMSRKQRKLYDKMKYSKNKRASERNRLEQRRKILLKEKKKAAEIVK